MYFPSSYLSRRFPSIQAVHPYSSTDTVTTWKYTQKFIICSIIASIDYVEKEMNYYILGEYSKLTQKDYRTRIDWIEKMIHKDLCKRFKFDYSIK